MLSIGPKMDGSPNAKYFESPESIAAYEGVKQWLQKNGKKYVASEPLSAKVLAGVTIQIMQFQEDHLGKNSLKPVVTRIPVKFFLDFKPGGGLCQILLAAYRFKSEHGWRKFELTLEKNSKKVEKGIEMIKCIEKALIQTKLHCYPSVYIKQEVDKSTVQKIKDVMRRRNGQVIDNEEAATHIIYGQVDHNDEYGRPVLKRDDNVIMHWYYFPNSYDTWVNIEEAGLDGLIVDCPSPRSGPWRVACTWVLESDQYNEWMSEEDYEVDESGKKKTHPQMLSVEDVMNPSEAPYKNKTKRKRSPSPQSKVAGKRKKPTSNKNKSRSYDNDLDESSKDLEDLNTDPSTVETNPPSNASSRKDDSQPAKDSSVADPEENEDKGEDSQTGKTSDSNTQDDALEDNVTEQTHHIIIPSYSAWFDYNSIHEVEKRALPEFFNGRNKSKTPEVIFMSLPFNIILH